MVNPTEVATSQEPLSDEDVVARVLAGETGMFEIVMRRHNQRLYRVARAILRNDGEAEDVMQDAYVRAYEHLDQFAGRAKFSTWLTRIAINAALAKLRKNHWKREIPIDEPNPACELERHSEIRDDAPDPEETYRLRERKRIVKSAISGLRPRARNIVELIHLQEHSIRETAQILGISIAAVKSRIFHARIDLHRMPLLQGVATSNRLSAR